MSALGATLLGVDDRAPTPSALLDEGEYAAATQAADEVTSRSDKALLVGLALPLFLLLLIAGAALWARRVVRARTPPGRADATQARLAAAHPVAEPVRRTRRGSGGSGGPAAHGIRRPRLSRGGSEHPQHPGVARGCSA